jgi:hypothetical protein
MTQQVSDETLGWFARKQADWFDRVRHGRLDPDEVSRAVQKLIDEGQSLWPAIDEMLERLRRRNEQGKLGLEGQIEKLQQQFNCGSAPAAPEEPGKVVLPSVSFGDPKKDLKLIGELLEVSNVPFRPFLNQKDIKQTEYAEGVERTAGARWVVLDLFSQKGRSSNQTRREVNPQQLPVTEPAMMFALAHEEFKRFRERFGVWGFDCAGLSVRPPGFRDVPRLGWRPDAPGVGLGAGGPGDAGPYLSVPLLRE